MFIYSYLNPGQKGENTKFWFASNTNFGSVESNQDRGGRPRTMRPLDDFFVICKNFHEEHLAHLFDISLSTVSKIFITWMNFMYLKLGGFGEYLAFQRSS